MQHTTFLQQIVRENESGAYAEEFALLAPLELQLRQDPPDAALITRRAHLQAAMGDYVGAHCSCTVALTMRRDMDLLTFRARCSLNVGLCLSGAMAFPAGHVPPAGALSARRALEDAMRDCIQAGSLGELDDEAIALAEFLSQVLAHGDDERGLRRRLRELVMQ